MTTYLQQLFSSNTPGVDPLFGSQRDLIRLVHTIRGIEDEKKMRSDAVFMSQMVHGKRSIPEKWKPFLQEAIRQRAVERGLQPVAIDILAEDVRTESKNRPLDALLSAQEKANDVLILNACPLELTDVSDGHAEAKTLQRLVFNALTTGRRYHYCLSSRVKANRLWCELIRSAEQFGSTVIQEWALRGLLSISIVPEILLLHPTVAFDTGMPDRLKVFVWHAPYDWDHCLELPDRQSDSWLDKVQRVLDTQSESVPMPA